MEPLDHHIQLLTNFQKKNLVKVLVGELDPSIIAIKYLPANKAYIHKN